MTPTSTAPENREAIMDRMRRGVLVSILALSCSSGGMGGSTTQCEPVPGDAVPFDPEEKGILVGAFRVIEVRTSWPVVSVDTVTLTLELATSEQQAEAAEVRIANLAREISHLGHYQWEYGAPLGAEVSGDTIYRGCRSCFDGLTRVSLVEWVSETGLWGRWQDEDGFAAYFDQDGRQLPEPAGHFCAERLGG